MSSSSLPSLIQRFFTDRLLVQLGASPHTVAHVVPVRSVGLGASTVRSAH